MMSVQQMPRAPVSISDLLDGGPEDFWAAADGHMSAWLVEAIQAALEHEIEQFAGAAWHERNPASRSTYRCGYRRRYFTVLGREAVFRMPRVRKAGLRSQFLGFRKRRSDETDRAIVNAHVTGASMREVTEEPVRQSRLEAVLVPEGSSDARRPTDPSHRNHPPER